MNESISELRIKCQHSYHGWSKQPWLFLQIRKISIYVTWVLLHTPLSPNAISVFAIGTGVAASISLAMGNLILGLILLQLAIILDFSDGEVSRYRNQRSKEGSYLDKIYIFLVHPALFAGVALYEFGAGSQFLILVAGFVNVISIFLFCMVIEYGRQVIVWRHFIKFISDSNLIAEFDLKNKSIVSKISKSSPFKNDVGSLHKLYNTFRKFSHKAHINCLLNSWDFPYVFVVMSIAIIIEIFFPREYVNAFSISPIGTYLYFYAISYPIIIFGVLMKNVSLKVIEQDYQILIGDFIGMLNDNYTKK